MANNGYSRYMADHDLPTEGNTTPADCPSGDCGCADCEEGRRFFPPTEDCFDKADTDA